MKNNNDRRRPKQQKTDEPSDVSMEPGEVDNVGGSREAVSMSRFLVESPASRPGVKLRRTYRTLRGRVAGDCHSLHLKLNRFQFPAGRS
jgi:hypothetical protein